MPLVEFARRLRGAPMVKHQAWLWNLLGKPYRAVLRELSQRRGVVRVVDGEALRWRYPYSEFDTEFERPVQDAFWALVRPGMVVLDIGASFGLYAIGAGKKVGSNGRVFAFEPLREMADVVEDHIALNGLAGHVELVRAAVTASPGTVDLWEPVRGRLASISRDAAVTRETTSAPRRHTVPATTIDEFEQARGVRADLVKIDVEGAEADVLRGAEGYLRRRGGRIILEAHPSALGHFGESPERIVRYLGDAGWRAIEIYRRGEADDPAATVHYLCEPSVPAE